MRSAVVIVLLSVSACGGASTSEPAAATSGGEPPTPVAPATAVAESEVIAIHPFAITAGPDGELLRLREDGTVVVRRSWHGRLSTDGRVLSDTGEPTGLAIDAAGEVRMDGEMFGRVSGSRLEAGEVTFELVPGAMQITYTGEGEERLEVEGNPPPRTALFLMALLMFASSAAGP